MSDSEDDDGPGDKFKKNLLSTNLRQGSRSSLGYKGVKSYLHQFYEYATEGNSNGKDAECIIKSQKFRVKSIWWKVALYTGIFLMIIGASAVLISYVVPRRLVLVEEGEEFAVLDKEAVTFNHNLELLKLAGLATFCVGGVSSSLALIVASCCWRWCSSVDGDLEPLEVAKKLVEEDETDGSPPLSPVNLKVAGAESVFGVQPMAVTSGAVGDSAYPTPLIGITEALD